MSSYEQRMVKEIKVAVLSAFKLIDKVWNAENVSFFLLDQKEPKSQASFLLPVGEVLSIKN